jgi:hypothetical protein
LRSRCARERGVKHVSDAFVPSSNWIILLEPEESGMATQHERLSRSPNQTPPEKIIQAHHKTKAIGSQEIISTEIHRLP